MLIWKVKPEFLAEMKGLEIWFLQGENLMIQKGGLNGTEISTTFCSFVFSLCFRVFQVEFLGYANERFLFPSLQ